MGDLNGLSGFGGGFGGLSIGGGSIGGYGILGPDIIIPIDFVLPPIEPTMYEKHLDGTAHPNGEGWGSVLPAEAQADYESHHFLADPTVTGRVASGNYEWTSGCCIHGYVRKWEYVWRDREWIYTGFDVCPQDTDIQGPHGPQNHKSTEVSVLPAEDDPLAADFGTGYMGTGNLDRDFIPVGDHHHVYTPDNDPFGLAWDHNHGDDPASWHDGSIPHVEDLRAGSGGWPRGQSHPNQTYTHTHIIRAGHWNQGVSGWRGRYFPIGGYTWYSPVEGVAGGQPQGGSRVLSATTSAHGYDHIHDDHGLHVHYHMYSHTHKAAPTPTEPIEIDPITPVIEPPIVIIEPPVVIVEPPINPVVVTPVVVVQPPIDDLPIPVIEDPVGPIVVPIPPPYDPSPINRIASGANPELIFLGGDVFGVQGYADVSSVGAITKITVTDPGATVVNVTEGTADDVGGDGIVSPEILITKPTASATLIADWVSEYGAGSEPLRWFVGFQATAHVSANPVEISNHLPQFFKSEGEARAETTSSAYVDPIAQTFAVTDADAPHGLFITSVDLCFQNKPDWDNVGDPITVEIRETVNGYPSSDNVLSGYGGATARRTLNPDQVNVADAFPTPARRDWENPTLFKDNRYNGLLPGFAGEPYATGTTAILQQARPAIGRRRGGRRGGGRGGGYSVANDEYRNDVTAVPPKYTRFVFPSPIFLSRNTEYAIVVLSNNKEYTCWISDARSIAGATSDAPGASGGSIVENFGFAGNPARAAHAGTQYGGSFFKSQNGRTWTADQNKDLMFRINRAEFNTDTDGTVSMSAGHWLGSDFVYDRAELDSFSTLTPEGTSITQSYQTKTKLADTSFVSSRNISELMLTTKSFNERMVLKTDKNSSADGADFKVTSTLSTIDSKVSPVIDRTNINLKTIRNRINDGGLSNNQINIVDPGTAFVVGNELDIHGGGGIGAKLKVESIGTGGDVISAYISNAGSGYYKAAYANVGFAAVGSGLTLNLLGEEGVSGGNSKARYITKSVTLAPDMDAVDLKVYLTASKPPGSKVRVYYRVLSKYDPETLDEKTWTAMDLISPDEEVTSVEVPGSTSTPLEFEFGTVDDHITYTAGDQTFNDFKTYAIKIVSFALNHAKVPIINDFRAIAVT